MVLVHHPRPAPRLPGPLPPPPPPGPQSAAPGDAPAQPGGALRGARVLQQQDLGGGLVDPLRALQEHRSSHLQGHHGAAGQADRSERHQRCCVQPFAPLRSVYRLIDRTVRCVYRLIGRKVRSVYRLIDKTALAAGEVSLKFLV